jgi:hypothetical protein
MVLPIGTQFLCWLFAVLCIQVSAYYFEDGYDHHYTYSAHSDLLGVHDVTTIMKVRHVTWSDCTCSTISLT